MAKNLLIVESPAKAKTIEGYLGPDFLVKSSYGHIRDLVKGDEAIDVGNDFSQKYEVPSDKKSVVDELKKRSEEHTSELQSLMRISYAVFCLKKKKQTTITYH